MKENLLTWDGKRPVSAGQSIRAAQNIVPGRHRDHLALANVVAGKLPTLSLSAIGLRRISFTPGQKFSVASEIVRNEILLLDSFTMAFRLEIDPGMRGRIVQLRLIAKEDPSDAMVFVLNSTGSELQFHSQSGDLIADSTAPWIFGKDGIVLLQWDGRTGDQTIFTKNGKDPLKQSQAIKTVKAKKMQLDSYEFGFLDGPAPSLSVSSKVHFGDLVLSRTLFPAAEQEELFAELMKYAVSFWEKLQLA